jgi:hypothetical protein
VIHSRTADTSIVCGKPQAANSRQRSTEAVCEGAAGFANQCVAGHWTRRRQKNSENTTMKIATLCRDVRQQIAAFETESAAYAAQVERGNDVFESSRAQSYSDGAAEALTATLRQLEDLRDMEESALEWDDSSADEPWESGILS